MSVTEFTLGFPTLHYDAALKLNEVRATMKPKSRKTYTAGWRAGRKARFPVLETAPNTDASHAIRHSISPPTREQLMARSANVRRVSKIEA